MDLLTKKEVLEKHYRKHEQRIAYPENVYKAMQEYANQEVIDALEDLLSTPCHPEYLKELIQERISELK